MLLSEQPPRGKLETHHRTPIRNKQLLWPLGWKKTKQQQQLKTSFEPVKLSQDVGKEKQTHRQ